MSTADTYIRTRIDKETKELASNALKEMGLSLSDAVRLLLVRVAKEHCLPFEIKIPNAKTRKAMTELESGKGKRVNSIDELMKDLNEKN